MCTKMNKALVLGLLLAISPGLVSGVDPVGRVFVRAHKANLKVRVVDVDSIRQATESLLANSEVECSRGVADWEHAARHRHIVVEYSSPKRFDTKPGETIHVAEILVPLPQEGLEFVLAKTLDGIRCYRDPTMEHVAALRCNKALGVAWRKAHADLCGEQPHN